MSWAISIIFVYFNTPQDLLNAINSLKKACGDLAYEIIVVDNASTEKIPPEIKNNKKITIITNKKNYGYGRAVNIGAKKAKGAFLLIANPDIVFGKNSVVRLHNKILNNPQIGIISPQMVDSSDKILPTISMFPKLPDGIFAFSFLNKLFPKNPYSKNYWLLDRDRNKEQEVDVVSGACVMIRKNVFDNLKGFDERFFMYFEESDMCYRVKEKGYQVIYYPKSKIIHLIGRSSANKEWIQQQFEKSRFNYFRKYHSFFSAVLAEGLLRLLNIQTVLLLSILALSLFINLYKINTLMMFYGDFGRDYLAARDMIFNGKIPLVGIQSSVVWLHQGPLSIYFIALAFLLSKFNPIAPAVFYGIVGVFSTFMVYLLGKTFFNTKVGLFSAAFFATSPLVVISVRMPYHTSSIPFFAGLFFFFLYKSLSDSKYYPWMFLFLGLLLLLELSNGVLFFLLATVVILFKKNIIWKTVIKSLPAFLLGISPFILYDITHKFVQTVGFPLWVINRIRLFFGLTISGNSTTAHVPSALGVIWQQISSILFPSNEGVVAGMLLVVLFIVVLKRNEILVNKNKGLILVLLWIGVPLLGYAIHAAPGTAYFPLIFPAICLLVGFSFYIVSRYQKIVLLLFIIVVFYNAWYIVGNNYFLRTRGSNKHPALVGYEYGFELPIVEDAARRIVFDANGKSFVVKGGGFLSDFQSAVDNYKYLLWYFGGKMDSNAPLIYTIFQNKKEIQNKQNIIVSNNFVTVTKYEKK